MGKVPVVFGQLSQCQPVFENLGRLQPYSKPALDLSFPQSFPEADSRIPTDETGSTPTQDSQTTTIVHAFLIARGTETLTQIPQFSQCFLRRREICKGQQTIKNL